MILVNGAVATVTFSPVERSMALTLAS